MTGQKYVLSNFILMKGDTVRKMHIFGQTIAIHIQHLVPRPKQKHLNIGNDVSS